MIKLNPVAVLGRPFPGMHPAPGPRPAQNRVPVPRQEELLTEEQAVSLIKEHAVPISSVPHFGKSYRQDDLNWLQQTTMFTILEGDSDVGRAIACNPIRTAMVLEQYDLIDQPVSISPGINYEIEDSGRIVQAPVGIIEFTYDFSLPEEKGRFRVLRNMKSIEYNICRKDFPKNWIQSRGIDDNIGFNANARYGPPPFMVGRSLERAEICGDPIPESMRKLFPKSHPVKFYDDTKIIVKRTRRSIEGLIRMAGQNDVLFSFTELSKQYNWFQVAQTDFAYLLDRLPRIMRVVVGAASKQFDPYAGKAVQTAAVIAYACFCNNKGPRKTADSVKIALVNPKNWQKFRNVIETMEELYTAYEDTACLIMNFLIAYLGTVLTVDGIKYPKMPRDKVVSYIRDYMGRCGVDEDILKSEVLHSILSSCNSNNIEIDMFAVDTEDELRENFVNSPVVAGYSAIFGKGGTVILNRDWYRYLLDPEGTISGEYANTFSIDPFLINEEDRITIRKNVTRLLSVTDSFTVDKENLRGGERLLFAKLLMSLNSEEIIGRAVKKNMTTTTDMKRALNYAVKNGINTSVVPYVIYLTKKPAG